MKKTLSMFIAFAIAMVFSSCGEEDCDHNPGTGTTPDETYSIVGSWYEEAMNEEVRYNANGTFYDRFSNFERAAETEGRWECDYKNMKLTEFYQFMGQNQVLDFDLKELTETYFVMASDQNASHKYEKIVETYNLEAGKTQQIQLSNLFSVRSYTSNNERIASVDADGLITAEGEKGTTYIKAKTDKGNVWVKVIVGDDCLDLWHDYVSIIGMNYDEMSKALAILGKPYNDGQDYAFGYMHTLHDIVDISKIFLCPEDGLVTEIQLVLKEAAPEVKILNYMNSHYYKITENNEYVFYSTSSDPDASKAIVAYGKAEKTVIINETEHFFQRAHVKDLWEDFTGLFGKDKKAIEEAMAKSGNSYLMTDFGYSDNGSYYYSISGSEYADMVGFVMNPDDVVSEYWVYMNVNKSAQDAFDYLRSKYNIEDSEETEYTFTFYNSDKSLRVVFDLMNGATIYTDLTKKQHTHTTGMFGNFHKALGLNHDEIISQLGNPFQEQDNVMYYIGNEYISIAGLSLDKQTQICNSIIMMLNEGVSQKTILDYCNSQFTVFEKGTLADGSQYAWTDGPSMAESKYGIIYVPEKEYVSYTLLNNSKSANVKMLSRGVTGKVCDIEQANRAMRKKIATMKDNIQKNSQQKIQRAIKSFR